VAAGARGGRRGWPAATAPRFRLSSDRRMPSARKLGRRSRKRAVTMSPRCSTAARGGGAAGGYLCVAIGRQLPEQAKAQRDPVAREKLLLLSAQYLSQAQAMCSAQPRPRRQPRPAVPRLGAGHAGCRTRQARAETASAHYARRPGSARITRTFGRNGPALQVELLNKPEVALAQLQHSLQVDSLQRLDAPADRPLFSWSRGGSRRTRQSSAPLASSAAATTTTRCGSVRARAVCDIMEYHLSNGAALNPAAPVAGRHSGMPGGLRQGGVPRKLVAPCHACVQVPALGRARRSAQ